MVKLTKDVFEKKQPKKEQALIKMAAPEALDYFVRNRLFFAISLSTQRTKVVQKDFGRL